MSQKYSLMIHGGCGGINAFTVEEQNEYLRSLEVVLKKGEAWLAEGKSALETVEYCVKLLEDDPLYNAGKGSVLNEEGEVEMDASIMDGKTLAAGAVAGIRTIRNPVEAARKVMEETPHVLLIGMGAEKFAHLHGVAFESKDYFLTGKRHKQLAAAKEAGLVVLDYGTMNEIKVGKMGTVGAVARDSEGNLAAATSTGGMTNKKFGRVGDSPIIGAGTYADNETCAISCTGTGEHFIKTGLAKFVSDLIYFKKLSAEQAAAEALAYFRQKIEGEGGFIVVDSQGNCASEFSTPGLIRGWVKEGEKVQCMLF